MKTMYEKWMEDRILKETGRMELSFDSLRLYQLSQIKKTIETAKRSKFYGKLLKNIESEDIFDFEDFKRIPFTTSEQISSNPKDFLCVSLNEIQRIVTINTSGTTGASKRIYFTENDLKATIEFFRYGMLNLIRPGQRVLILMPGSSPFSIGQLLKEGLHRAGCEGVIYGSVYDIQDTIQSIMDHQIDCMVGIPTQVYYLAKQINEDSRYSKIALKSILLSADYVPRTLCSAVENAFHCPVFAHYGMTETGYGGGVECSARNGYHMRDVDLYSEIIDPVTGDAVAEGIYGEVVFTTFAREGMPLLRYRTGDIARFLPANCSCSAVFKRMDYVTGRLSERFYFNDGSYISIAMLDEIIFGMDDVLDYKAAIKEECGTVTLSIAIKLIKDSIKLKDIDIKNAIMTDRNLVFVFKNNNIMLEITSMNEPVDVSNGMTKRKLLWNK